MISLRKKIKNKSAIVHRKWTDLGQKFSFFNDMYDIAFTNSYILILCILHLCRRNQQRSLSKNVYFYQT